MWKTIALLMASNLFMTVAWYGHLKYKNKALWLVNAGNYYLNGVYGVFYPVL